MKLKEKINIDFEEFFATGKFDFLKLGKTKEWVMNNFPDPDGFDEDPEVFNDDIWYYGNIELHFNEDELFLIYSDYINDLDGGDSLELEKWVLEDTNKLKLSDIIHVFNEIHLNFCKKKDNIFHEMITLELDSGVSLTFQLKEDPEESNDEFIERCKKTNQNEFQLSSFCLMRR